MKTRREQLAYMQGRKAFNVGRSQEGHPYVSGSKMAKAWQDGFRDAARRTPRRRNPAIAGLPVIGYAIEHPVESLIAAGLIWWAINPRQVQTVAAQYGLPSPPAPPSWLGQFTNSQPVVPGSNMPTPPPGYARPG